MVLVIASKTLASQAQFIHCCRIWWFAPLIVLIRNANHGRVDHEFTIVQVGHQGRARQRAKVANRPHDIPFNVAP